MGWEEFGLPRLGPGKAWLSLLVALGRLGTGTGLNPSFWTAAGQESSSGLVLLCLQVALKEGDRAPSWVPMSGAWDSPMPRELQVGLETPQGGQ